MISLIAPPALLVAPRPVHALGGVPVDDFITQIKETLNLVSYSRSFFQDKLHSKL